MTVALEGQGAPLTDEQALYMKHLVLQALQDAHDSTIKPENYFKIIKHAVLLLAALETTVAMTTMIAMIERGLEVKAIHDGLFACAMVSSLDARRICSELDREMRLVQMVKLRDPLKVN